MRNRFAPKALAALLSFFSNDGVGAIGTDRSSGSPI